MSFLTGPGVLCPFLASQIDLQTALAFASTGNICISSGTPLPISLTTQCDFCLTPQFEKCPAYAKGHLHQFAHAWDANAHIFTPQSTQPASLNTQKIFHAEDTRPIPSQKKGANNLRFFARMYIIVSAILILAGLVFMGWLALGSPGNDWIFETWPGLAYWIWGNK